jgi:hypothetical protein
MHYFSNNSFYPPPSVSVVNPNKNGDFIKHGYYGGGTD